MTNPIAKFSVQNPTEISYFSPTSEFGATDALQEAYDHHWHRSDAVAHDHRKYRKPFGGDFRRHFYWP